jgi:hypothetical protein
MYIISLSLIMQIHAINKLQKWPFITPHKLQILTTHFLRYLIIQSHQNVVNPLHKIR